MALFYDWLGSKKSQGIRLAVMDMWKLFRNATAQRAPKAAIYSTSSTSCGTWARLSMPCARASKRASPAASGATSRAEVHAALAPGEPVAERPAGARGAGQSQQAARCGLHAEGVLRTALRLSARSLGAEVLRQLERQRQVAAPEELPEVRRHDRPPLERHRAHCRREQGLLIFCILLLRSSSPSEKTPLM